MTAANDSMDLPTGEFPQPKIANLVNTRPKTLAERQARKEHALKIVNRYMLVTGGVGMIPAPFFGQVIVAGLLGKMLYDLCRLYGTTFTAHKTKAIVSAVLGGAHSAWISEYMARYMDKAIPGTLALGAFLTRPAIAGAVTYAVGMLFIHHLDTGAWLRKPRQTNRF